MNETAPASNGDIEGRIASRLKAHRDELGLSLADLAARSGVSRAMISRIERREASPTAALLGRLCAGLGITLSGLMAAAESQGFVLLRAAQQPVWRDPATGFQRRAVTPAGTGSPVEIVDATLPPGARIAYPALPFQSYDQHILGLAGCLTFESGAKRFEVRAGDCLHCALDRPHGFANDGDEDCRYLVVIAKRSSR